MFSVIYTPTEGEAIQNYSRLFRKPEGCFLNIRDQDSIEESMMALSGDAEDIDYIVVSDGEEVNPCPVLISFYAPPLLSDLIEALTFHFPIDPGNRRSRSRRHSDFSRETGDHHSLRGNPSIASIARRPGLRHKCEFSLWHCDLGHDNQTKFIQLERRVAQGRALSRSQRASCPRAGV